MSGTLEPQRRGAGLPGNRRLMLLVAALVAVALAAVLVVRACAGGDEPPRSAIDELLPDTTLVYASVSTDGDRGATERLADLVARFDAYEPQRDALLRRLSGADGKVNVAKDIEPWMGDEAAIALMDAGQSTAGSIVAIQVTDRRKARAFLDRNPRRAVTRAYKGFETRRYGSVTTAFVEGHMVIGQDPTVQMAIDRSDKLKGEGVRTLADQDLYKRAVAGLPEARAVTAYASADGLRRLLTPQGGLVGGLATTLDNPALQSVAVGVEGEEKQARITTKQILDPEAQKRQPAATKRFEPSLVEAVPEDAMAYLGASGVTAALQRLLVTAAGGQGGGVTSILGRLRTELDKEAGGSLQRDLLGLFEGEVAIAILARAPAPLFALITKTKDEANTRETLNRLREPLARLLRPEGEPELRWSGSEVGGREVQTLTLPTGAAISYAVFDGRLVLGTGPEAIKRVAEAKGSVKDAKRFDQVLGGRPDKVGTLGFLDFSQLLELGEQTGLNDSRQYLAAREDLQKIRAIGVSSSGTEGESTAEILVSIP